MYKIDKIAIKFGDNDFYNVFMDLMNYLKGKDFNVRHYDREYLLRTINNLLFGFYLVDQRHTFYQNEEDLERIKNYLTVTDYMLKINDEVDLYLEELAEVGNWDNSESFFLDYTTYKSYVWSL